MQDISLTIEQISHDNLEDFWKLLDKFKFRADIEYYESCVERHVQKKLMFLIVYCDEDFKASDREPHDSAKPQSNDFGRTQDFNSENKNRYETPVGFCILNWQPKYAYFKKFSLPEIQDINVLSEYRRRGIGEVLLLYCEGVAKKRGYEEIGIGVGLDSSFGAAQRLYVRLGYIPDGAGVCYDRKTVAKGEFRPIDENLSLMMTKKLI